MITQFQHIKFLLRSVFGWSPGVGDGQGGLACCGLWGCKESDMTERLNQTELIYIYTHTHMLIYMYVCIYTHKLIYLSIYIYPSLYIYKFSMNYIVLCLPWLKYWRSMISEMIYERWMWLWVKLIWALSSIFKINIQGNV